jgi:hypothetical protein
MRKVRIKAGAAIKTLFTKEVPEFIRGQLDNAAFYPRNISENDQPL